MEGKALAVGVCYSVMKNNQLTVLQDYWHRSSDNFRFTYSREMVDAMAAAGVKNFVGEYNRFPEGVHINDFLNGRMNEDVFKEVMMNTWLQQPYEERQKTVDSLTDFLKYSQSKGIKFHAPERCRPTDIAYEFIHSMNVTNDTKVSDVLADVRKRMEIKEAGPEYIQSLKDTEQYLLGFDQNMKLESRAFIKQFMQDQQAASNDRDKEMAEYIKANCPGKTVLAWGAYHGGGKNGRNGLDFDEYAGGCAKIGLSPNPEKYREALKPDELVKFAESASTIIYTDDSRGNKIRVMRHNGSNGVVGSEVDGVQGPDKYRNFKESDLNPENYGNLCPPNTGLIERISQLFARD